MEALAALLGSPQLEYEVLHVTGTNGKTSVARIASALLTGNGVSTGTYTSPHLERVNERMSWDGTPIDDADPGRPPGAGGDHRAPPARRARATSRSSPAPPSRGSPTSPCEAAVVEVGMGGTWDATNVVDGAVAVVTNVSIDHVEYLGATRELIAADKAGIVEPGGDARAR